MPRRPRLAVRTLHDIGLLQHAQYATPSEVMQFIEVERLYGKGCGGIDLTLLASTLVTPGARLWTLDRRLAALATQLNVGWPPNAH